MSGVELAGLVIGTFPLLIAALEQYETVTQPTKTFFTWKKHRRRLIQELYTLRASYDQAMTLLLKPIADTDDVNDMLEDALCDKWSIGEIADELREVLGVVYDPLILAIGEIAEILTEIAGHLDILGSQQGSARLRDIVKANPPTAQTQFLLKNFEFGKRLQFTMKKTGLKTSLERLEKCTQRIDTWVGRAENNTTHSTPRRSKLNFTGSLGSIQKNASKIYSTLFQSWCKKEPEHGTLLLMEQRLKRPRRTKAKPHHPALALSTEPTCFKLGINGDCLPTHHFYTEFRILETITSRASKVRLTLTPAKQSSADLPYDNPSDLPPVLELCHYIQKTTHKPPVGFCLDDTGELKAYGPQSPIAKNEPECVTLESLLPDLQPSLPLEELYSLAITLVASTFQLSPTPWLHQTLSKKEIVFLRTYDDPTYAVNFKQPYLERSFTSDSHPVGQSGISTTNHCSNLLALAVLLLEINFGLSIEEMQLPEDLGKTAMRDDKADLQTVHRWYKASRPRLTNGFSTAILTCLQEHLNPAADFGDSEYCNVVKEKILQPLEDEMQYVVYGPPT